MTDDEVLANMLAAGVQVPEPKQVNDHSMFEYVHVHERTGQVMARGRTAIQLPIPPDCVEFRIEGVASDQYYDFESSTFKNIPEQPGQYHKWDWNSKQWVFNQEAQAGVWADIQAERSRRSSQGVKVGEVWFHSDPTSRAKYTTLVVTEVDESEQWKAMGDVWVTMTDALALQVLRACAALDKTLHAVSQYHRAQMLASTNPERYDWRDGWPASPAEASVQ